MDRPAAESTPPDRPGPTSRPLPAPAERWFESYGTGRTVELGAFRLGEEEIVEFASRYDPQPMHVDREVPGGVIASGWHTVCMAMRLIAEHYLPSTAGLPSPGVESLRWPHPVRPGDAVHVRAQVLAARVSGSLPDRGIVTTRFTGTNQAGLEVLAFEAVSFVRRSVSSDGRSSTTPPGARW